LSKFAVQEVGDVTAHNKRLTRDSFCKPLGLPVVALLAFSGGAAAQEVGGLNVTFDVTERIEQREEEGLVGGDSSGLRSLTTLDFGLSSETRSQSLAFVASSGLAIALSDDSDVAFEDTFSSLDYARSSRDSALSFGLLYRRDEVDDLVFDTTFADDDIVTGEGQREVFTLNSELVLGREARVTGTFNHTYETSVFLDALDPTLNDTDTQAFDARFSFQLSRTVTADVFGNWREIDERGPGATDRETYQAGTSLSYEISPITTVTGLIAYSEEESRGTTVLESDGLNYGLSFVRIRPNGEITVDYLQEEALTGTRRQLTAGQDIGLQRGSIAYSLGVTETEGFDPQLLADLTVAYDVDPTSNVSLVLSQDGTINGDDDEVVNTRLNLTFARGLTPLALLGVSFALVDEDVLADGAADQRSFEFGVTFGYDLAQDWGLTTGYEFSSVRIEGTDDRNRSSVYLGLQKSFAYRP
jgi:hypothetical protein